MMNNDTSLRGAPTIGKFTGISVLNAKGAILNKINVSYIVSFCLGKYSFSLNTFCGPMLVTLLDCGLSSMTTTCISG